MSTCSFEQINLFGTEPEDEGALVLSGPDLASYDWIVISSSAGKDSQTILRHALLDCDAAAVPRERIVVVHSDLGRFEWPGTKELAQAQVSQYGVRFEIVRKEGSDLLQRVYEKFARRPEVPPWMGFGPARWCTSDFKRGPIWKLFTRLSRETRQRAGRRKVRILNVMGMRAQESRDREKMRPFSHNRDASNKTVRHVDDWLPIHGWPVEEVWSDIRSSGVPYHSVYDRGMSRLSCRFCFYAPPPVLLLSGSMNPELLEEFAQAERHTGYTFKRDVSLVQIQASLARGVEVPAQTADWEM